MKMKFKKLLVVTALALSSIANAQVASIGGGVYGIGPVTGTGPFVRQTSPVLVTPALGTPASGVATNLTGTAAGLTAGNSSALLGSTWATPAAIGTGTPLAITGTTITATTGYSFPSGTAGAPGIFAASEPTTGIFIPGSQSLSIVNVGTAIMRFTSASNVRMRSASTFGFTSGTVDVALDTALSRGAAGVLAVGTGAAASTAGIIDLTGIRIAGAATSGNVLRGNGTNFVSAQLAAADLSNYVEGSWTPTITNTVGTYTTTSTGYAIYTRVGRLVTFQISVTVTTSGTATGSMNISLPVTLAARDCMGTVMETVAIGESGVIRGFASGTEARLRRIAGTDFGAGAGTYRMTLTCDV